MKSSEPPFIIPFDVDFTDLYTTAFYKRLFRQINTEKQNNVLVPVPPELWIKALSEIVMQPLPKPILKSIVREAGFPIPVVNHRWAWFSDTFQNPVAYYNRLLSYQVPSELLWKGIVMAGNIIGSGMISVFNTLFRGQGVIIKPSKWDTQLPYYLLTSLIQRVPKLAAQIYLLKLHSSPVLKKTWLPDFLRSVDALTVYGSDKTIQTYQTSFKKPFIGYGHKMSAGLVSKDFLTNKTILEQVSWDICLFDRRGCLSPQVIWVQTGGGISPKEWASQLHQAMIRCRETQLPVGTIDLDEMAHLQSYFHTQLFEQDITAFHDPASSKEVVLYSDQPFSPLPAGRIIMVRPYRTIEDLIPEMSRFSNQWQGFASTEWDETLRSEITALGFNYLTQWGKLQTPPLDWKNDGIEE